MNKWQEYYRSTVRELYGRSRLNRTDLEYMDILGRFGDMVRARIPGVMGRPDEVRTFAITFDEDDFPRGKISVFCLLSNVELWLSRGGAVWPCDREEG